MIVWKSYHKSDFADTDPLIDHDSENEEVDSPHSVTRGGKKKQHNVHVDYELDVVVNSGETKGKGKKPERETKGKEVDVDATNIPVHSDVQV